MKGGYVFVWLDSRGFVYERVLFIPNGTVILFDYKWERINSCIRGML